MQDAGRIFGRDSAYCSHETSLDAVEKVKMVIETGGYERCFEELKKGECNEEKEKSFDPLPQPTTQCNTISGDYTPERSSPHSSNNINYLSDSTVEEDEGEKSKGKGGGVDESEGDYEGDYEYGYDSKGESSYGYDSNSDDTENTTNLAAEGEGKGKRKADILQRYLQGHSTKRAKLEKDGQEGKHDKERERKKGGRIRTRKLISGQRPYACPYFKNDPPGHQDCAKWNNFDTFRVKYNFRLAFKNYITTLLILITTIKGTLQKVTSKAHSVYELWHT